MKNTLTELHDYLFEQLERVSDDTLKENELRLEVERSRAMTHLTNSIISNGRLALDAQKFKENKLDESTEVPEFLGGGEDD